MSIRATFIAATSCLALAAGSALVTTPAYSRDAAAPDSSRPDVVSATSPRLDAATSTTGAATFGYTGGPQDWLIPRGVQSVFATLVGGAGGVGAQELGFPPKPAAAAARVSGTLSWPTGTFSLNFWVGGRGGDTTGVDPEQPSPGTPGVGGWNGGAAGGTGSELSSSGGGGGGATDIRIDGYLPDTRVMVAGGGGGQGGINPGQSEPQGQGLGGSGGIGTATAGVWAGADGGTALGDNGGRGGSGGFNPGGQGTAGGNAGTATGNGGGGGGGGGWFAGEGGGAGRAGLIGDSGPGGGGGGGSSYAEPGFVTNATAVLAEVNAPPQATVNWVDLTATSMPDLIVGASVQQQLPAAFPVPSTTLSWSVTGGRLPAGVSLSSAGVISGTPTQTGNYEFTVTVIAQPGALATSTATLRGTVRQGGPAPSAPSAVSATGGVNTASVSWSPPVYPGTSALTNYQVRWSSNSGATWSSPLSVPATQTSTTVALAGGQTYVFEVAAVNATATGPWSGLSNAVAITSTSVAPTNVTGTAGYESVTLTWQAPTSTGGAAITGYFIRYSTDGGGSWAQLPNTGSSSTTSTITGLTSQAGYLFEVAAINAAGTSPWSAASSLIFPEIDPNAPSDVIGVSGYQSVELSWLAPPLSAVPVTGYLIRYSDDSGTSWSIPVATGSTALTFDYTGLTQPVFLIFQVAALSPNGSSAWSAPSAPVSPETRPSPPTKVRVTAADRSATLTWNPPADLAGGTLSGYRIEVRNGDDQPWRVLTATTGTTATRYHVENLMNATLYEFRLAAITQFGVGLPSTSVSAVPYGVPGLPTNVAAAPGNASVSLTWQAPVNTNGRPVLGYRIEAESQTGWYLITPNSRSAATSFSVTGLTNGQAYRFRVAAINIAGVGTESIPSAVVRPTSPPPQFIRVRPGDSRAQISWQAPSASGASPPRRYRVEVSAAGGPWTPQCHTTSMTCMIEGLATTLPYRFRVIAIDRAGTSRPSQPSAPVVADGTPSRPVVTSIAVDGATASITVAPGSLGGVQLQHWDQALGWRIVKDSTITLGAERSETRVRAVDQGQVSPSIRITVNRPVRKQTTMQVTINGSQSSLTGIAGHHREWRTTRAQNWRRVTTPFTVRYPEPPRPWTFFARDTTAAVTVAIQIR